MKIKSLYFITILIISGFVFSSNSGGRAAARGQGNTGAPGEATVCGNCHTGGAYGTISEVFEIRNSMGNLVTEYVPGETYDVSFNISASTGSPVGYGFQMTSLENTGDTDIGTWQNPSANVQIATAGTRTYTEHNGTSASSSFTMEWVAPALGTGPVTFYYVGNAVNGANGRSNDNGGFGSSSILTEAVLPVELTDFQAHKKNRSVLLSWETASEINNRGFHIEYSNNGKDFEGIGWVEGAGNSSKVQHYQFIDESPSAGTNYYRLLQVDFDGTSSYSDIKTVLLKSNFDFDIYPNPSRGLAYIECFTEETQDININVFSMNGQLVKSQTAALEKGRNTLSIPVQELVDGVYIISVRHGNNVENIKLNILNN